MNKPEIQQNLENESYYEQIKYVESGIDNKMENKTNE